MFACRLARSQATGFLLAASLRFLLLSLSDYELSITPVTVVVMRTVAIIVILVLAQLAFDMTYDTG